MKAFTKLTRRATQSTASNVKNSLSERVDKLALV